MLVILILQQSDNWFCFVQSRRRDESCQVLITFHCSNIMLTRFCNYRHFRPFFYVYSLLEHQLESPRLLFSSTSQLLPIVYVINFLKNGSTSSVKFYFTPSFRSELTNKLSTSVNYIINGHQHHPSRRINFDLFFWWRKFWFARRSSVTQNELLNDVMTLINFFISRFFYGIRFSRTERLSLKYRRPTPRRTYLRFFILFHFLAISRINDV